MIETRIRLLSIQLNNLNNVKNGSIDFDSKKLIEKEIFDFENSDIVGIYGPNGSSKTAIVNSFVMLKNIIISKDLKENNIKFNHFDENEAYDLINKNENEAIIELTYFVEPEKIICFYEVVIGKNDLTKSAFIKKEKLSYKMYSTELGKWNNKTKLVEVDFASENLSNFIQPSSLISSLRKCDKSNPIALQRLIGSNSSRNDSFIFSELFISMLKKTEEYNKQGIALQMLKIYAINNMHVYDNKDISQIAAIDAIPFFYSSESNNVVNTLVGKFTIFGESVLDEKIKPQIFEYFKEIDIVINKIIPDMHVEICDLGNTVLDNGNIGFRCEVISIRNNVKIPLRLESDGIKKIISLITSMVDIYNNKYSLLVVDEFDSGIFEYLLGELLKGFKEEAKGQFLFTSHNLRALEVIKDSIVFSSTDENNRYIYYPRISKTENLRSQYIRKLFLDNIFAEQIDIYDIYRSFIKAGEIIRHE